MFDPATHTRFARGSRRRQDGRRLRRYDFTVRQEHSQWFVGPDPGFTPAYRGSIQVGEEDGGVYHLNMEAHKFPHGFFIRDAWLSVEYDSVRIQGSPYLMPVEADLQACQRGAGCERKIFTFANYRQFTTSSTIAFPP